MKRFHVHIKVKDLEENINFYNALFKTQPTVVKSDYAKWLLEDPKINFAISLTSKETGVEHLGFQTENLEELQAVYSNLKEAKGEVFKEGETTCCYSKSEKSWITDPQGVSWETFYTHGPSTVYGKVKQTTSTSCSPSRETSCC